MLLYKKLLLMTFGTTLVQRQTTITLFLRFVKKKEQFLCLHCHVSLFKCYKTTPVANNITLVTDERIRSIWCNRTEKRTLQYSEKDTFLYHFAHKNSRMDWP